MCARVFVVMLRVPHDENDLRDDPFWEFGSFGCTRCHSKNLLHPKKCRIGDGDRLAFVQGGLAGLRLLLITPPVKRIDHPGGVEVRWDSRAKPFRYQCAPSLFRQAASQVHALKLPRLRTSLGSVKRSTLDAKFASRYRSRTRPLDSEIEQELLVGFDRVRKNAAKDAFITRYEDALPQPCRHVSRRERKSKYERLLKSMQLSISPDQSKAQSAAKASRPGQKPCGRGRRITAPDVCRSAR